jgi:uncharacterized coiled-coil protein SlyX
LSGLEERLARLERAVAEILRRLDEIAGALAEAEMYRDAFTVKLAAHLVLASSMPALAALKSAERILASTAPGTPRDEISLAVMEALAGCEPLSISEVTRAVKASRGRASRRIVRERILRLESAGSLVNVGTRERPRYTLRACLETRAARNSGSRTGEP